MKLSTIVAARPLMEEMANMEMNGAGALAFAGSLKVAFTAIQEFEKKRADYFMKYGEETGEGEERRIQILPENEKKFNAAIKRSLGKEIDLEPISIDELGISIAPAKLVNIDGLFV